MYRPFFASGSLPSLSTEVTKMRSPQTIGDDQPRPGRSICQAMFLSAVQVSGSALSATLPCAATEGGPVGFGGR